MKILMVTNTFTPHVGGVAHSVERFTVEYRKLGHEVLVVAPTFEGEDGEKPGVLRIPAIQRFNGSDFSVPMPIPRLVAAEVQNFDPDIVHSHHPFLLGDTALRVAAWRDIPVVFTHHTLYERYTHYVPVNQTRLACFVIELTTGYCNLCDAVIAPSRSIEQLLRERGVTSPISVVPTGIDLERFRAGDGSAFRRDHGISPSACVVGHVGRLAEEKNLAFLATSVARFLATRADSRFLVVGEGPAAETIVEKLADRGLADRLLAVGRRTGRDLANAYAAMDVFAFASHSETQGIVLVEAMAAGVPVVAVDAPGVREVVRDGENGRLLARDAEEEFASALQSVVSLEGEQRDRLAASLVATAERYSGPATAAQALALYSGLIGQRPAPKTLDGSLWASAMRRTEEEWLILKNIATAAGETLRRSREAGGESDGG